MVASVAPRKDDGTICICAIPHYQDTSATIRSDLLCISASIYEKANRQKEAPDNIYYVSLA